MAYGTSVLPEVAHKEVTLTLGQSTKQSPPGAGLAIRGGGRLVLVAEARR